MELNYAEIVYELDMKYVGENSKRFKLKTGLYQLIDLNLVMMSSIPNQAEFIITIDDIRLRSGIINIKTKKFGEKFFLATILGLTILVGTFR